MTERSINAEEWARRFHETYERLAPEFGYETREASARPWADVPERNRGLMTATAGAVLGDLLAEVEAYERNIEDLNDKALKAIRDIAYDRVKLRGQVVTLLSLCDGLKRFEDYDPLLASVPVHEIERIFEGFDRGNVPVESAPAAHVAECEGGHTREISCAEVAEARDEAVADPWWCRVSGAYHMWDVPTPQRTPEAVCAHGCGQVWSELAADLAAAEGTGTPEVDHD